MSFTASRPGSGRLNAAANTKTPASQLPRSTVIAFRPLFPSFPLWTSPLYNTTSITRPRIMILPTQANNICPTPHKLRLCRAFVWAHPASGFNLFRSRAQHLRQTAVGRSTSHSPAPVSCTTPACRTILPFHITNTRIIKSRSNVAPDDTPPPEDSPRPTFDADHAPDWFVRAGLPRSQQPPVRRAEADGAIMAW